MPRHPDPGWAGSLLSASVRHRRRGAGSPRVIGGESLPAEVEVVDVGMTAGPRSHDVGHQFADGGRDFVSVSGESDTEPEALNRRSRDHRVVVRGHVVATGVRRRQACPLMPGKRRSNFGIIWCSSSSAARSRYVSGSTHSGDEWSLSPNRIELSFPPCGCIAARPGPRRPGGGRRRHTRINQKDLGPLGLMGKSIPMAPASGTDHTPAARTT
jgi:hypothetical protein